MVHVEMGQVCQMQDFFGRRTLNLFKSALCQIFWQCAVQIFVDNFVLKFLGHELFKFPCLSQRSLHICIAANVTSKIIKCIALIFSFAEFSATQILQLFMLRKFARP